MTTTSPIGNPPKRSTLPRPGFSLLELILVLALVALSAALVAPSLGRFARNRQAMDTAADLLALARHAQGQAAHRGVPYRLNVDPASGTYWLTVQVGGAFARTGDSLGKILQAPQGVTLTWLEPTTAQETGYVQFEPDGAHSLAVLQVSDGSGNGARLVGDAQAQDFRLLALTEDLEVSP